MIKYLGSKRALAGAIAAAATELGARSAADLFAGTTRVGQALRAAGIEVVSNDTAAYSEAFGRAYVAAGPDVDRLHLARLLRHLGRLPPVDGYVTETFCRRSRYFMSRNGPKKIAKLARKRSGICRRIGRNWAAGVGPNTDSTQLAPSHASSRRPIP